MTQIHAALSHYWHLRDQGLKPANARAHVLQRYGVEIDAEQPLASTSIVVDVPAPASKREVHEPVNLGFGSEFTKTAM